MLDKPGKTLELLDEMKAAAPFEVEITRPVIASLKGEPDADKIAARQTVSQVHYSGDEGGILCAIDLKETGRVLLVSLTHLRLSASLPFAAAALDYQKHRTKKLKKLERRDSLMRSSYFRDLLHSSYRAR